MRYSIVELLKVFEVSAQREHTIEKVKLDWPAIHQVQESPMNSILAQHQAIFQEGLGTLAGYYAQIQIHPSTTPKFCKARTVPYAYRALVNKELDRLVDQGI